MKKYIKFALFPTLSILVLSIVMTILNLFKIEINKIFLILSIIVIMFISGLILGKNIKDKGYLKGLIYGGAIALTMFVLSLILLSEHSFYNIIYYVIIIATTTVGTMFGINK